MNKAREQAQEREDTAPDAQRSTSTKVGIHNVMGLGAPNGQVDQKLKLDCMMEMWEFRNWSAVLLADVKYTGQGVREVTSDAGVWTIVHHGKVAIALNEDWAARWRAGGAEQFRGSGGRVMALGLPGRGWRRGHHLVEPVHH